MFFHDFDGYNDIAGAKGPSKSLKNNNVFHCFWQRGRMSPPGGLLWHRIVFPYFKIVKKHQRFPLFLTKGAHEASRWTFLAPHRVPLQGRQARDASQGCKPRVHARVQAGDASQGASHATESRRAPPLLSPEVGYLV